MSARQDWDEVIRYIDSVRPGFAQRIRPASSEEISRLEGVIGRPLFEPYRLFLERMGKFDDEVFMQTCGFSETIEAAIARAVEVRDDECGPGFFNEYLELGASPTTLLGLRTSGDQAGHVVVLNACKQDERHPQLADSLLNLLYYCGFVRELDQLSSQTAVVSAPADRKREVLQYLTKTYRAERYSDTAKWFGRGDQLLVFARWLRGDVDIAFTARALARSVQEAERAAAALGLAAPVIENS